MQKEHQPYNIQPADRLANVSEYYFSRKLKEVAQMNAEGKNVISLGIGSPDMPPSEETVNVLCEQAKRPDAHGYQPTVGIPELRKAMADWYKRWYHVEKCGIRGRHCLHRKRGRSRHHNDHEDSSYPCHCGRDEGNGGKFHFHHSHIQYPPVLQGKRQSDHP